MSETIIIAILGSGLLSTIINQLCSFYQRKAEQKTGVNSAHIYMETKTDEPEPPGSVPGRL